MEMVCCEVLGVGLGDLPRARASAKWHKRQEKGRRSCSSLQGGSVWARCPPSQLPTGRQNPCSRACGGRDLKRQPSREVFSPAGHPAGAIVSLWKHLLGTCLFALDALEVPAVDRRRKGLPERWCKPRREQEVSPRQLPSTPTRALLMLGPFLGRSRSKGPCQSVSHRDSGRGSTRGRGGPP